MDERPSDEGETLGSRLAARLVGIYVRHFGRFIEDRRSRIIAGSVITAVAVLLSAGLLAATFWLDFSEQRLKGLGYAGIFLVNLVSTSTFFIPVPGLTAAGQALIVSEASSLGPVQVGLLGGAGMGLGEITAYVAGALGREVAQGRRVGGPQWFQTSVDSSARAIGWLMASYGMLTLFVLSVIPNPAFEIAGLTAGAVHMKFWRFLLSVLAGKIVRGLALAYIGYYSVHILGL
jgi:membrane protein DedA with SNARE-associated domain